MKVLQFAVLLIIFTATFAYPATDKTSTSPKEVLEPTSKEHVIPLETEIAFVPLEEQHSDAPFPRSGVVDVDANSGGFAGNPFNENPSIFDTFNALMYQMRQQLNQMLGRLPERSPDLPFPELHLPDIGHVDLGKGNTTSVTKIIDGHKVTINETEYKQERENGGSFFKVRVIDVHPDSAETTEKSVNVSPKDRESMEDTDLSNEIPKVKDNEVGNNAAPEKLQVAS